MKFQYLIFVCLILLAASCGKDNDNPFGLPNATQSGENTFGCLINGEPWVAEVRVIAPGLHEVISNYDEENFGLSANNYFSISTNYLVSSADSSRKEKFSIRLTPILSEGVLDFSQLSRKDATFYARLLNVGDLKIYRLDTMHNNYVNITKLDTLQNNCAGKYELLLINEDNEFDSLFVTEGRFDVLYQPQ